MNIEAVIIADVVNDLGTFKKNFVVRGKPALELVKRGLAKLIEEKRDTRSPKKVATRGV